MGYGEALRAAMAAVGSKEIPRGQGTIAASLDWLDLHIHPGGGGYTDEDILAVLDRAQVLLDGLRAEAERKIGASVQFRVPNRRRARR